MACFAWMETVAVVHISVAKLHIEDIDETCIGQLAVINIFLQNVSQYGVVNVAYLGMERFSSNTICTIACIDGIRV